MGPPKLLRLTRRVTFPSSCSRDEKRYAEKKNKSERARRKQEDNVRVRELVDTVLANDPRIKRIRAEEKAARDAKKNKAAGGGKPVLSAKEKKEAEEKAAAEKKIADEAAKKQEVEDKVRTRHTLALLGSVHRN